MIMIAPLIALAAVLGLAVAANAQASEPAKLPSDKLDEREKRLATNAQMLVIAGKNEYFSLGEITALHQLMLVSPSHASDAEWQKMTSAVAAKITDRTQQCAIGAIQPAWCNPSPGRFTAAMQGYLPSILTGPPAGA